MQPRPLVAGEIVQVSPERTEGTFGGCLMIVAEGRSWGALAYVRIPGKGLAYYRAAFAEMEPTGGTAQWVEDI